MRKVFYLGAVCLVVGISSCKTHCPAYNYAKLDSQAQENLAPNAQTETATKTARI